MSTERERFAFGQNWEYFAKHLQQQDYFRAKQSLQQLIGELTDKSFLDVGCGSGLFSIAASALGARCVLGFDVDAQAVKTARSLVEKIAQWDPAIRPEDIEFKVESILNENLSLERFDVVYSWGVLHHTGQMYKAFDRIRDLVADDGLLVVAIYNKHWTSPLWRAIKRTYVVSPRLVQVGLVWAILLAKLSAGLLSGKNPFKRARGMRFYTDLVDWVGGYPYEYASVDEVTSYFTARGFELKKLKPTTGCTGCNEFVFERRR